jgi:exopolyphosphatase/pppGpp-phosphohydrolase
VDPVGEAQIHGMRQRIEGLLGSWTCPEPAADVVYACSGSIRRLAAMKGGASKHVSLADLTSMIKTLSGCPTQAQRLEIPGIDPDRCDVLLPAALIHEALAQRMKWPGFNLSAGGLRLGLLERSRA